MGIVKDDFKNVLVTYSSGFGTTREISAIIAGIFSDNSQLKVDLKSIDTIQTIQNYQSIIIGSSIRADKILANTRDFFAKFHYDLAQKKVALFLVCLTAHSSAGREKVMQDYLPQIVSKYNDVHLVSVEAFGGKIDFKRINPVMQHFVKKIYDTTGLKTNGSVDARDWDLIQKWAHKVRKIIE